MESGKDTFVANRPDQRRALSSPIRLEILGQFTDEGGMSIGDVAARIGRSPGSLYYHFRILETVGLLVRVGARPGVKRDETLYEPVAPRIAVAAETDDESSLRSALKTMEAAFRMAERDLEAALTSGSPRTAGKHRNLYATRVHCRLTKQKLAEINEHLRAIERILLREAKRKELPPDADQYCSLTLALLPLRGRDRS